MAEKELRKGYTTGVHTFFAFNSALQSFLFTKQFSKSLTNKMDNDDLDVTKNCEIVVCITDKKDDLQLNPIPHLPHVFNEKSNYIEIYAGKGVGVVTKKGLKIAPDFPAINPVPLNALKTIFEKYCKDYENLKLYAAVGVTDGEELSRQTANSKVGVLGGISILGTTGIVKPVSSSAYIDSVATEIEVASQSGYKELIYTLGNSAFNIAKRSYDETQIVEIGNFIYDAFKIAKDKNFEKIIFMCGIGKMTKVAQNFKNTHNRFGQIDFSKLKNDIETNLNFTVDTDVTLTVKGICEQLGDKKIDFYEMINRQAYENIRAWHEITNFETIILDENEVKGW